MITTTINITPYLAEYLRGKYASGSNDPINIPDNSDLYHVIWNYMSRRPSNMPHTDGEGKNPEVYNYLSARAVTYIELAIRREFNEELHATLLDNDQRGHLFDNNAVVYQFLCTYGIESVSEEALLKNYYRWRENLRKRKARRERKKDMIQVI